METGADCHGPEARTVTAYGTGTGVWALRAPLTKLDDDPSIGQQRVAASMIEMEMRIHNVFDSLGVDLQPVKSRTDVLAEAEATLKLSTIVPRRPLRHGLGTSYRAGQVTHED
jgi:hypothetical protein